MRGEKKGFVLGVFLFAYNSMVRRQNIQAHHEQIGEVAGMLALTGANLLAEQMTTGVDQIVDSIAPALKAASISPISVSATGGVLGGGGGLGNALAEFNAYLQQLVELKSLPICRRLDITFDSMTQITSGTAQMNAGGDLVEKLGEMSIACVVEYQGLRRKALVKRQFRVVNLIPGPMARFTLFVPFTPAMDSYNSLGVVYNGNIDSAYQYHFTDGTSKTWGAPLKIFNGTDSNPLSPTPPVASPNPNTDLANRGWVFLGPSYDNPTAGPVIIRIQSGYNTSAGGHFQLARSVKNDKNQDVIPPEGIPDSGFFALSPTKPYLLNGVFQGFFTAELNSAGVPFSSPVSGKGVWTLPADSAASWLMPFGDVTAPSRTLVVGPVLAGFMKFYLLKDSTKISTDPGYWSATIKTKVDTAYDQTKVINDPIAGMAGTPFYQDVFKPSGADPAGANKAGFDNLKKAMPVGYLPGSASSFPGISLNACFDFMAYPPSYPSFYNGSTILAGIPRRLLVPNETDMNGPLMTQPNLPPGIHRWYPDFCLRFRDGNQPADFYFKGDLSNLSILGLIAPRVSHIIDLTTCNNIAEENAMLAGTLFRAIDEPSDPNLGKFKPQKRGIYFVRRNGPGSATPLSLPDGGPGKGIFLNQHMIIIVDRGDIRIPNQIKSDYVNDAPGKLLTVVALDGNIILDTNLEIDAYLIALKTPINPGTRGGGKLLCGSANAAKAMNIFGGVAAYEMGLYPNDGLAKTTMTDFLNGGMIRYNPRFNPSNNETYKTAWEFIPEDKASSIEISGVDL